MKRKHTSKEVLALIEQAKDLVKQGTPIKVACASLGIGPSTWHYHMRRGKIHEVKEPHVRTPVVSAPTPRLNYCPSCGCNLKAISIALTL